MEKIMSKDRSHEAHCAHPREVHFERTARRKQKDIHRRGDSIPHVGLSILGRFLSRQLNSLGLPVRGAHWHHYLHRCVWRDATSGRHYRGMD